MEKPLPKAILKPKQSSSPTQSHSRIQEGIPLDYENKVIWNPIELANGHVVIQGTSGSGKSQIIKIFSSELLSIFKDIRIYLFDYHGDLKLPGETCYAFNMESPYGINPLIIDLDTKGGGPNLQAIAVANKFKDAFKLGANQEGTFIDIFNACYRKRGIIQEDVRTWSKQAPTFADVRAEIEARIESGCKESVKLQLKLAATFQYGIFDKVQPSLEPQLIRFDMSALAKVVGLTATATEALIKQFMDSHRLMGESPSKIPKTYIVIDEAKEVKKSPSLKLVFADGRKYSLNAIVASQRDVEIADEVIANSATKIILPVDQSEVRRVAKRFRFAESVVANLQPLEALVRMGTTGVKCQIKPYYLR